VAQTPERTKPAADGGSRAGAAARKPTGYRDAFPREAWVKYRTLRETIRYTDPTTGFDGLCIPCGLVVWQRCPDERVPSMLATQQGPDRHLGPEGAGALLIL
jgi:hypothetical protein